MRKAKQLLQFPVGPWNQEHSADLLFLTKNSHTTVVFTVLSTKVFPVAGFLKEGSGRKPAKCKDSYWLLPVSDKYDLDASALLQLVAYSCETLFCVH